MKPIILVTACLLITYGMNAQEQSVSEEEISFNILKWHYSSYPNSQGNQWTILNAEGEYYRVRFEFNDQSYFVEYDQKGMITHEVIDLEDKVPVSIIHELESYDKYKINRFLKINDKEKDRVIYKLVLKVKSEGKKTLWFDESLIQIPNTDFSKSITEL